MVARSHVKWCADRPGVDSVEVDDSCIQADQRASPVHKGCRSPGSVTSQPTKCGWERENLYKSKSGCFQTILDSKGAYAIK